MIEVLIKFSKDTGFAGLDIPHFIMLVISCILLYLAIVKKYEPLLLIPIGFGMLLSNLPVAGMMADQVTRQPIELIEEAGKHIMVITEQSSIQPGGLLKYFYQGNRLGIFPPIIFMGIGAMTDFGPLIANPKSLLLGAAAQLGIFTTFIGAIFLGFTGPEASSIGIIGVRTARRPYTYLKTGAAPLGPIAVAAYSYMALVPIIQPPIMKALTTKKERMVKMEQLREVSKTEKILFPIIVTIAVSLSVPSATSLVGMLMLGNLFKESGVVERLSKTAANELINIVTIILGVAVGASATAETFLRLQTIQIIVLGVLAFGGGTAGGILFGKLMYKFSGGKVNPLIGSAGVSAVPMAARVSQVVGQRETRPTSLLMHAMGPNVAGVIGSAVAAGVLLSIFG